MTLNILSSNDLSTDLDVNQRLDNFNQKLPSVFDMHAYTQTESWCSILAPMLFNIYINDLPMVASDGYLKSYIDDLKLLLSFSVNEVNSAVVKPNEDLQRQNYLCLQLVIC
jgi:hypothetical protein